MKPVTQADIARALGLSQPTVGLVVGNSGKKAHEKLAPETIRRIQQKAQEMGYRPHRHAQAMRGARTTLIGLIHGGGLMQVSNERAYAVAHALKQRGYNLLTLDIHHKDAISEVVEHMLESHVDGIIVACTLAPEDLEPAIQRKLPIVGLASNELPGVPIVRSNMSDGFHRLVTHFHGEGHKRLVQLTPARPRPSTQWKWQQALQIEGFREGLKDKGGSHAIGSLEEYAHWRPTGKLSGFTLCMPEDYPENCTFNPFRQGRMLTHDLLRVRRLLPDVILSPNDDWAFGSINELLRAGLDVPSKITVAGFNDACIARDFFIPFTTVRQPTEAMSQKAVELLIQKIENPTERTPKQKGKNGKSLIYELPCELVIPPSSVSRSTTV